MHASFYHGCAVLSRPTFVSDIVPRHTHAVLASLVASRIRFAVLCFATCVPGSALPGAPRACW